MGHFVTFIKSEHASNCVHFWTYSDRCQQHSSQRDSLREALRDIPKDGCVRDFRCIIHLRKKKQKQKTTINMFTTVFLFTFTSAAALLTLVCDEKSKIKCDVTCVPHQISISIIMLIFPHYEDGGKW